MSASATDLKSDVIALHIIDGGVSVHTESLSPLFEIDDMLVIAFISALYSYTFAIGKEYIQSIDFEKCKFLFRKLYDEKLLVLITKGKLTNNQEEKLLEELALKYEVKTDEMDVSEIDSLLKEEKTILPIEVIAEIKRKKRTKREKRKEKKVSADKPKITLPSIPQVKTEEFYMDIIATDKYAEEKILKVKQVLSNFFLGYSDLILVVFLLKIDKKLATLIFGRINEDKLETFMQPVFEYVYNKKLVETNQDIVETDINGEKVWLKIDVFKDLQVSAFVLGKQIKGLIEITPHIKRISKFLNSILEK